MILRNTAGQPILIGPLELIADGAAVTSGASIFVDNGSSGTAGGGTLAHFRSGTWRYTPTQAETDTAILGLQLEATGARSVPLSVPTTRFPAQTAGVLPDVAAGASGGVPLIGSAPLTNLDAAVSTRSTYAGGAVASVTGAVGSVTAPVTAGTVTDKTGYSLTQSFPTNFASLAITGGGAVTAGTVSDKTGYSLATAPPTAAAIADAVWDEAQAGHTTAGTFGLYLDAAVSGVSTGGVSAAAIADAVWDEARSGHATAGTFGERVDANVVSVLGTAADPADVAEIAAAVRDVSNATPAAGSLGEAVNTAAAGGGGGSTLTAAEVWTYSSRSLTDKAGYSLAAAGLDAVAVEAGINARQALSVTMAATAGRLAGSGTGTVTIYAGGQGTSVTRITATVDEGNRTAVTLNLPA